jgi:aryl-alcohol dehydrogenase-like predicted oxidoreductase
MVWDATRTVRIRLERDSIRRECEASLRRLRVEAIDLYQIHWPPPTADDGTIEEGWTALAELRREGKVRWIGVSNFDVAQIRRAQAIAPVTSLQPPYSMLRRGIEAEILPYCASTGIGVIGYSPMLSGMLSGGMTRERALALPDSDWRRRNAEFQEPRLSRNLDLVEHLRAVGARHGRSPGEVAIAWVLQHPAITGAIVGARSAAQVDGWVGAAEFRLTEAEMQEIASYLNAIARTDAGVF